MLIVFWLVCVGDGLVKVGFVKVGNDFFIINEWVIFLELVFDYYIDLVFK